MRDRPLSSSLSWNSDESQRETEDGRVAALSSRLRSLRFTTSRPGLPLLPTPRLLTVTAKPSQVPSE